MTRATLCAGTLGGCLILLSQTVADAGDLCPSRIGPDVIVGDLWGIGGFGVADGIGGYSIATDSCNIGDEGLIWVAATNQHPVIAQNMYRLKDGRLEQIGQSWIKHGFGALALDTCCVCQNPNDFEILGIGCSDPYTVGLNGQQGGNSFGGGLGPRSDVNPVTGAFAYPYPTQGQTGDAAYKRLQVHNDDFDPALNVGARYFGEGHYVAPTDALAGNGTNNASYREVLVGTLGSSGYALSLTDVTHPLSPAIQAWQDVDPSVTLETIDVTGDGRFHIASRASDNGDGTWRYDYAVHNLNSDRAGGSFSVPVSKGTSITNVGFHAVQSHSGEPYSNDDWPHTISGGAISWSTTDFSIDPDANAIRWGTMYNFWFDADAAPTTVDSMLGLFKPGSPAAISAAVDGPDDTGVIGDLTGDGLVDVQDLLALLAVWGRCPAPCPPSCSGDLNGDCQVDTVDLLQMLANWS
jgi:hypothetical protein